ncbi:MAG: transcriptional regulator, PadR-like family [Verrucomicrobia bacterium]|nr:transcriptional regulator, PadR-like family [Verrucomicrobiota bacterium]
MHKGSVPPTTEMSVNEKFTPLRKGLLEFLVLKVISAGQVYAADILAELNATEFATQEGTLYPLLSKLRREEWVDYEWQESEAGPPRKYYKLTAKGREQLRETLDYWQEINATIKNLGQKKSR